MGFVQFTIWIPWIAGFAIYLSVSVAAAFLTGALIQAGRGVGECPPEENTTLDLFHLDEAVGRPVPVAVRGLHERVGPPRA